MTKTNNKKQAADAAKARKVLKARHVAYVCAEIERHRNPEGKIPWGVVQKVYSKHKELLSWLTLDLVKKGLQKRKGNVTNVINTTTSISDLTNPTFDNSNQESNEQALFPPMDISITHEEEDLPTETSKAKGGRPKGTTIKASIEKEAKTDALIMDIASCWSEKVEEKAQEKIRMKKNELDDLINSKKQEHGLTDVEVKKKAIQMRTYRKRLLVARHPGPSSPMKPVEDYIVSILNQMAPMRQSLCVSEGLALANALIEGTEWEEKVVEFKKKRGWKELDKNGNKKQGKRPKRERGRKKRTSRRDRTSPNARNRSGQCRS